jgi:DNA repair exonuclease SbcCD ATPase subunit
MRNTFLREVHLQDFRTFGTFTLPVPPGPGLTLLVGTNGLGKSSFFDGIEWCLTGRIRRLQDYVGRLKEGDYLTRRDARPGTHRVRLTFSEGEPLTRALSETPADGALLDLLKDPAWTEIKDVGAYLGFTHFLGQASQQRFTSRDQADQWQALKGPSGIDRLESIRTALRGRPTTNAFRRRTEREQLSIDGATRALEDWHDRVARLAELGTRGAAAGAESEAALDARLATIAQALPSGDVAPSGFAERLVRARAGIESEQRRVAQSRAALDGLRAVVTRFADSSSLTDADGTRRAAADAAVATTTTQLSEAMLARSQAEQAAAAQAQAVAHSEAKHEECVRVRTAIAEFVVLDVERQAAQSSEAALKAERDTCQANSEAAQAVLRRAHEAQATLSRFDNEQATLQLWSTRVTALLGQEASAHAQRDAATAAGAAADRARAELPGLERAAADARDDQAAAEAKLAARRRDASELAELLSGLAGHIDYDDTNCPVCASKFAPGELQNRARGALAAQDAQLAEEVRALDVLRDRTSAAAQALNQVQAVIAAQDKARGAAEGAVGAAAVERAAIADGLGVAPNSDLASIVAVRLAAAAQARSAHLREAGGSPDAVSTAQARVDALTAMLASVSERLTAATQRRSRCDTALRAIEDSLGTLAKPWSAESADAAVEAQAKLLAAARASFEDLALRRAAAANAEIAAQERLAAVQAERDRLVAAIRDAESARSAAVTAWQAAGMDGHPAAPAIDAKRTALNDRATALAAHLEEINALSRSYDAWLAQHELRTLRTEMDALAGEGAADNPVPHEQFLQAQLATARAALQLTADTRDAVVAYGEQLKTEAESFSTKFLLPLNDLIDAFNRALLSTPGETVQFNAEHTVERTALAMALRYADPIENAQYKTTLPPQLVLSEGQMAANGFSILCAASTAYRWSRWRALLLDDPLQHNDIIHAAAFVDVMRNLVQFEGYQLIMSSHKRDEGEFIARKFDAAGLPCTVVELIGASKNGVRIEPPRHNAAARALLAEPQARLA